MRACVRFEQCTGHAKIITAHTTNKHLLFKCESRTMYLTRVVFDEHIGLQTEVSVVQIHANVPINILCNGNT
jgi:hypothetical protein